MVVLKRTVEVEKLSRYFGQSVLTVLCIVPPVLFRTNYYSIEIPHGVTAISLTYHPHHAKLQVLPVLCIVLFFNVLVN